MEKTYQLDQREQTALAQLEQERTQALAVVGALSLDMETAKKNLDVVAERQRGYLRMLTMNRGVDRFENTRAANGQLIVTVPDARPAAANQQIVTGASNAMVDGEAADFKQ